MDPPPDPFVLIGRLAVGVAHDINNYLAAAEVALSFAERGATDDVKRDLRQVRASFDGIVRIARSLTSYARGASPEPEKVELEPLIRRVLDAFARMVPEGVRVVVESAEGTPKVRGVAAELEQLVLNLALNACDAMPEGGTLWMIVERAGPGHVRLEVSDTGGGLPAAVIASAGPTSPSSKLGRDGGGLGLGIVRAIVARHEGTVVLGRTSGGGTNIEILLPAA